MGFGNPYRDAYNEEVVMYWVDKMVELGIEVVSMADTVGLATADQVSSILEVLIPKYNNTVIGVHLHSTISNWQQKVQAAVMAGSTRFDGALKGIGGCPMAGDDLVGNMDTELMIPYFESERLLADIDKNALKICSLMASEIFI
jgi:hydroxymethylglutaryl-CoA lyase